MGFAADTSHSQLASRLALEDELASEVTTANVPGDTNKLEPLSQ